MSFKLNTQIEVIYASIFHIACKNFSGGGS